MNPDRMVQRLPLGILVAVGCQFGAVAYEADLAWRYDDAQRPAATTSSAAGTLVDGGIEARACSRGQSSDLDELEGRSCSREVSPSTDLDARTPSGLFFIIR